MLLQNLFPQESDIASTEPISQESDIASTEPIIVGEEPISQESDIPTEIQDVGEGITETDKDEIIKAIQYDDVVSSLILPIELDFNKIVSVFEKNADFLTFHSSLNTYVATYLGYDFKIRR